jgi:hypothetical protein
MRTARAFVIESVLMSALATQAMAQQGDAFRSRLVGVVVDTAGRVVRHASILLDERPPLETDTLGRFRFDSLMPGQHRLTARAIGYAPLTRVLSLAAGTADARITLSSSPYHLPELSVRARNAHLEEMGFYQRRAEERRGRFIEGDSLMRLDSTQLSLALSRLSGFHLKDVAYLDSAVTSMPCRKGFRLYVNGWEIDSLDRAFYFRTISPAELEAAEIYENGTPPAVFTGRLPRDCLIALWEK